jgi:response regulator RpfG family c-di-GMP phosphodiesterase
MNEQAPATARSVDPPRRQAVLGLTLRTKTILVSLPILICAVVISGVISLSLARAGMTRMATRLLDQKADLLREYAASQWDLVVRYDFVSNPAYVEAARASVAGYALSLTRSASEVVLAANRAGVVVMSTRPGLAAHGAEQERLRALASSATEGWVELEVDRVPLVGQTFAFAPLEWQFVVAEERDSFEREIGVMTRYNLVVLAVAVLVAVGLLVALAGRTTRPVARVVEGMRQVVNNLALRVDVEYADEIGMLAHEFNLMAADLQRAHGQIRGTALAEARARHEVAEREQETLNVLSRATDSRSSETANHVARVGLYAELLARAAGLSPVQQDQVRMAAPLHDIGKFGIPDSILIKPGLLEPTERVQMQTHTTIAYDILRQARSFYLRAGAEIALTHHERWDGSGYPRGLKGTEIPLFGRIVGIVDVFDALTSRRPYKDPWRLSDAFDYLRRESGHLFDPELARLFLESEGEITGIRTRYPEPGAPA